MVSSNLQLQLNVELRKPYPIYLGEKLLDDVELLKSCIVSNQVLIVTNNTVANLYLNSLKKALSSFQCDEIILEDGEEFKNQQSLNAIYNKLVSKNHHRDTTIVALGGGVVGDIAGFAASTYQRGVNLIQIPSTLMAQVDSSIGGKTAINHMMGKNLIGSFYQPNVVLIDFSFLSSLPARQYSSGLAEIIKYAVLEGGDFFKQLDSFLNTDASCQNELYKLIFNSCKIKSLIIAQDEKEEGQRALLNLGHTFAHALETYTEYKRWLHGEAVAIGLYCAALLSFQLGCIDKNILNIIDNLIQKSGLPNRIPKDINIEAIYKLFFYDKKIKKNKLRFILIKGIGDCFIDESISEKQLQDVLREAYET